MTRDDFIVRPFLGMVQIINKVSGSRQNVTLVPKGKHRLMVRKNDYRHIFTNDTAYDFAQWLNKYIDDANFLAICNHFTGGQNFYDRATRRVDS